MCLGSNIRLKRIQGFQKTRRKDLPNSVASCTSKNIRVITQNDINVLQFLYGAPRKRLKGNRIDDLDVNLPPGHPYLDIV